jgi:hypothetical protein
MTSVRLAVSGGVSPDLVRLLQFLFGEYFDGPTFTDYSSVAKVFPSVDNDAVRSLVLSSIAHVLQRAKDPFVDALAFVTVWNNLPVDGRTKRISDLSFNGFCRLSGVLKC